jgi:hypothetical protein
MGRQFFIPKENSKIRDAFPLRHIEFFFTSGSEKIKIYMESHKKFFFVTTSRRRFHYLKARFLLLSRQLSSILKIKSNTF